MRRRLLGAALAALLVTGVVVMREAVKPSVCESLTPDNWFLWWWHGCGGDSAGGGGSGAG